MGQLNVSTRADGRVALRTLARPERLNALSAPLLDALEGAIADADDRPEVRAVVVAGEGRAFCAAADIAELQGASRQQAALRAGELGVVNRVAGDGEALDTALDWATRLTERPPL